MEGKTKSDRLKNQTKRMGLGMFPHSEIIELVQSRRFAHVVRMGDGSYPKLA